MKTELIIKPEDQAFLDAIKSTGKTWYELELPEHKVYPQFRRKLVVTGFNTPDMEGDEDRIYVNVRQYLTLKESNVLHKKKIMPNWPIHENNVEDVMGAEGVLTGMLTTTNDEGVIVSEVEQVLTASSIQYVRFLIKSRSVNLVDILARFMTMYVEIFNKEINDI